MQPGHKDKRKADFLGSSPRRGDCVKLFATYKATKYFRLQKKKEKCEERICPEVVREMAQRNYSQIK